VKKRGVNFIDCSELYPLPSTKDTHGRSERYLGNWLAQNRDRRDELVIATKVVGYMKSTFLGLGRSGCNNYHAGQHSSTGGRGPTRLTREQIIQACNASLARLQVDTIDLYLFHWPDRYVPMFGCTMYNPKSTRPDVIPFSEMVQAIKSLVDDGKIRHWGISNETAFGVCEFVHAAKKYGAPPPVVIQNNLSLLNRSFETSSLAEACHNYNISLMAYSPLCGGALTGKYIDSVPTKSRFDLFAKFEKQFNNTHVRDAVEAYEKVASAASKPLTDLALQWCAGRPCMKNGAVIVGATKLEQLEENINALTVGQTELGASTLGDIDQTYLRFKDPVNGL